MSEEDRLRAYKWITKNCRYNVGILHNRIIDRHNIYQTTLMAMKKALVHLLATCPGHTHPSAILVDAMPLNISDTSYKDIPIYHFINGEKKSSSIAAASIVAKVTRDRLMAQMAPLFPAYQLASHKGYCTQTHQDAIHAHRHSVIHRLSFLNKMYQAQAEKETPRQQSLF
jgi:ribonuclease HII